MKYFEPNPQTLLLVNPVKTKRKASKPKRKAGKRNSPETKAVQTKATEKVKKSKEHLRVAKVEAKKLRAQLKASKAELKAAKIAHREDERKKKMAKNPKKVVRRKRKAGGAPDIRALMAAAAAPKKRRPKGETAQKQAASWRKYASGLGMGVESLKAQTSGSLKAARSLWSAQQKAAGFAEKEAKRIEQFAKIAAKLGMAPATALRKYRTIKAAKAALEQKQRYGSEEAAERAVAQLGLPKKAYAGLKGLTPKQIQAIAKKEAARVARMGVKQRKGAAATRKKRALPKGTKITELAGYPPVPPPAPGPLLPKRQGKRVSPHDWRPPIMGRADPGWWLYPESPGGYAYKSNPKKRKKAKKATGISASLAKLPIVGGMFKPKRGKKNPEFSIGEIAKIAVAGGAGYLGGGIVQSLGTGLASSVGLSGRVAAVGGAVVTVGAAHMLFKSSDFYVPVVAGASIAAIQGILGGGDDEDEEKEGGFLGGITGKITGMFSKGGEEEEDEKAMGYLPSDDDLLSSIDSGVGGLGAEYIDLSDSWDAGDPTLSEYVDIPMEDDEYDDDLSEYVGIEPMGSYEELADDYYDDDDLSEYVGIEPMGDDDVAMAGYDDDMEDELEGLAEEYSSDAGVDYGSLTPEEAADLSEYVGIEPMGDDDVALASFEELADDFEELADDYEELAGLGYAVPRGVSRRLRQRSRRLRKAPGARRRVARRPRVLRDRAKTVAQGGTRKWVGKLAAQQQAGAEVAQDFRAKVQEAVLQATQNTQFETGSAQHFRAAFNAFKTTAGTAHVSPAMRRAFLVAYRAVTRGKRAGMAAAKVAGVPTAVAAEVVQPPEVSAAAIAQGEADPGQAQRVGGALTRRVRRQPRTRRVRRAGEGRQRFGGIFAQSIFGERGRWR
ncbi:MAG: hypothetical protein ABIO70_15940 [Pseudomonadota bacterium]